MCIKLLDCTLRDGGHINNSKFGEYAIKTIISDLVAANVDIIEVGFLRECEYSRDKALFTEIKQVKRVLPSESNSEYALMLQEDQYNWENLEENDGTISYIRVSFHNYDLQEGLECCKKVIEKGYKCFVNPINLPGYSDMEILQIISEVNKLNAYAFTIVDTFGVMKLKELSRIYQLLENNLNKNMVIAIHLHENLSLAYSLAQNFIEMKLPTRTVVIDGSLYGMGRVPGNLCIELIMDYLNETRNGRYKNEYAFDAIDEFIEPIKKQTPWGHSSVYALSAQFRMHRSYAEYLLGKNRLRTKDMKRILESVEECNRAIYQKDVIERKYIDYVANDVNDSETVADFEKNIDSFDEILVLAPGSTISEYNKKIEEFITERKPCIISVNFIPENIACSYHFFSNIKRYQQSNSDNKNNIIISSNLKKEILQYRYMFDYRSLVYFEGIFSENSTLMFFNLLKKMKVKKNVYCAGFDGFKKENNFWNSIYDREIDCVSENNHVMKIVNGLSKILCIRTITPTMYGLEMINTKEENKDASKL